MKILIATDGSEYSRAAVEKCCELFAKNEISSVRIISVAESPTPIAIDPYGASVESYAEAQTKLGEQAKESATQAEQMIIEKFEDKNLVVETAVVIGNPKELIVEEAQKWNADLIVLGSHGYGFWERMLLGSVSNAIVHHAPCSVLIVRKTN